MEVISIQLDDHYASKPTKSDWSHEPTSDDNSDGRVIKKAESFVGRAIKVAKKNLKKGKTGLSKPLMGRKKDTKACQV